jgi:hypothetical protein
MIGQLDLLEWSPPIPAIHFSGSTYVVAFDCIRLNKQMRRVHDLMADGCFRTLRQISDATGDPEASVSARLRDYRSNEYLARFFIMESERLPACIPLTYGVKMAQSGSHASNSVCYQQAPTGVLFDCRMFGLAIASREATSVGHKHD